MPLLNLSPGLTIHYDDHNPQGSPAVLLLHGMGVTGSSWQLQVPILVQAGFRVLTPDARGFGQSTFPAGRTSIGTMSADMATLLRALDAYPAHIVGISMGGALALQLAIDYPQLISRLVLVNTFARLRPINPRYWLYYTLRFISAHTLGLPTQARLVARRLFPCPKQEALRQITISQILEANPNGYRAALRALAVFNALPYLQDISCPTLVVTGLEDTAVPPQTQRVLVEKIPNSRQVVIPNAGHAVIIDQADIFNRALLDFLQS